MNGSIFQDIISDLESRGGKLIGSRMYLPLEATDETDYDYVIPLHEHHNLLARLSENDIITVEFTGYKNLWFIDRVIEITVDEKRIHLLFAHYHQLYYNMFEMIRDYNIMRGVPKQIRKTIMNNLEEKFYVRAISNVFADYIPVGDEHEDVPF